MRDILAHHYFEIDVSIVWDTVTRKMPALEVAVRRYLGTENEKAD